TRAGRHGWERSGAGWQRGPGGAVATAGTAPPRLTEGIHGRREVAELSPDLAEREPGRGKVRRQLHRLLQQVGRRREVAAQLQVAREIVAAVGNQIAGGQEKKRGPGAR